MSTQRTTPVVSAAGIYLSVPFCRQKCTYCNFASDAFAQTELPRYLRALEFEIAHANDLWQRADLLAHNYISVDSTYMGGGTPGLLSGAQLASLLEAVRQRFDVAVDAEITIEASPENVTEAVAVAWAATGINRVSMGVQSMVARELRAVGRMHDAAMVARAVALLRDRGIQNISLDLIAGLPHQTEDTWEATLDAALRVDPEHISVYMLEVDDDSRLGAELRRGGARFNAAATPSEEQVVAFYLRAMERFASAGFEHYEISNFARPSRRSRHNEKHWINAPYFGFGLDAHSYDGEHRWANVDSLSEYLRRIENAESPIVDWKQLKPFEKLEERFFLGLRRREGISIDEVKKEFAGAEGLDIASAVTAIENLREYRWLETCGDRLRLTDQGVLFSNEVFAAFLTA